MTRHPMIVVAALTLAACGGAKPPSSDSSAADTLAAAQLIQPSQMPAPDTMKADTVHQPADSAAKAAAARAATGAKPRGDYDRAIKPKGTVDEKTGKVTPIKP